MWSKLSSVSYNGLVIVDVLQGENPNLIQIEAGYPSDRWLEGEDPRNGFRILKILKGLKKFR